MDDKLNVTEAATLLSNLLNKPLTKFKTLRLLRVCALGHIPVYWRNSAQICTRLSDFKGDLIGTDSFSLWMQLNPVDLFPLETQSQTNVLSFALTDQDCDTLERLRGGVVDADGNVKGFRHAVGDQVIAVSRNQLFINESDVLKCVDTLATDAAPAHTANDTVAKFAQLDAHIAAFTIPGPIVRKKPTIVFVTDRRQPTPAPGVDKGQQTNSVTVHTTKGKKNHPLAHIIIEAQKELSDKFNTAAVWANLQALAAKKFSNLLGETEDGIQYPKKGETAYFTKDALAMYLKRQSKTK